MMWEPKDGDEFSKLLFLEYSCACSQWVSLLRKDFERLAVPPGQGLPPEQCSDETKAAWDKTEALMRVAEIYGYVPRREPAERAAEAAKASRKFNFTL